MDRIYRVTLFALYQLTLLAGIALLPLAMVARRVGVVVPVHRPIERLRAAYDRASAA